MIRPLGGVPPLAAVVGDVLLGLPPGVTAAAAFAGADLSRIRHVLLTGSGPAHVDPAAAAHLPVGCVLHDADDPHGLPAHIDRLDRTDRTVAWALATTRDGLVLHAPGDAALAADALARLRDVGARVSPTGPLSATVAGQLAAAGIAVAPARTTRRVLVTGGSRSGKSSYAEHRLMAATGVTYVATGAAADDSDPEWADRVRAHRNRRPTTWATAETIDVAALLTQVGTPLVIDGIGTWLSRTMDACQVWDGADTALKDLAGCVEGLVRAWSTTTREVVAVTDEVGSGVVPATASGRLFRDELGRLNAALAEAADEVWLVVTGVPWQLR